MSRDPEHPVWDVYDQLRTSRLNVKYYSCRVAALQRQNFWVEIILAATASGSAVAGLTLWNTPGGRPIWQMLLVGAAVLAVAKPLLQFTDRIQRLEELVGSYRLLEHELRKIEIAVRQRKQYDAELQERFASTLDKMNDIYSKKGEYKQYDKLRTRCEAEVAQELPSRRFFIPEGAHVVQRRA